MTTVVLRNGTLFDGHRYAGPGAVVVRDGRIAAVVTGRDLDGLDHRLGHLDRRSVTEVDLRGGLVAPGFVDAHVHAVQGGLERIRCDLSEGRTREDYLTRVAAYARRHPELPWILGGGWAMAAFPGGTPTAADLDAVVPDRPVFLPNRDHHGAWVNSRALEIAGVDAHTPDPSDGRFERDAEGRPTGTLHEGAMHAVARHVPETGAEDYYAAFLAGQSHLHSVGVTGWQDAIVGAYAGMDDPGPTYLRAARAGDLTAHVVGALWWDRDRGEEQVADLVGRRAEYTHGRFRATSVKIMQDGVAENGTAAMTSPYLDRCGHATANAGHSFVDPTALSEVRRVARRRGLPGARARDRGPGRPRGARRAARTRASPRRPGPAPPRRAPPGRAPRRRGPLRRRSRVAANIQALWACLDEQMTELTLPFLGEQRSRWQYPFGDLHRAGARLVAGSDWPVSTPDPLAAIHVAVNRTAYGEPGPAGQVPFLPEQALTLETAFAAYTSGSAWVNHRDDAGVLAAGKVADLVVLDRDPFAGPADEIGATRVVSTWVEGRSVFEA